MQLLQESQQGFATGHAGQHGCATGHAHPQEGAMHLEHGQAAKDALAPIVKAAKVNKVTNVFFIVDFSLSNLRPLHKCRKSVFLTYALVLFIFQKLH